MEVCCSLKSLANGSCGTSKKQITNEIVPLFSCTKSIKSHLEAHKFSGPVDEVELILCRVAIFKKPLNVNTMTICPNHRAVLCMGWGRGGNTRCRVPEAISGHGKSGKKFPKAEKGLDKRDSLYIFQTVGIFVPAGSGKR